MEKFKPCPMLIVDMPIPKNCAECLFVTPYSKCVFLGDYAIDERKRADNCPIKGELVRCGECLHLTEINEDGIGWCPKVNDYIENFDYYCADGKRKGEIEHDN